MKLDQNVRDMVGAEGKECLVFVLGDQEYGIDILSVQEIRGHDSQHITTIVDMPTFIKGITNLRGIIVPIIDLRVKFNLARVQYTDQTVVIILNIYDRVIGVVVDGVSDVVNLQPDQIKEAPQFHASMSAQYLTGIGTMGERMIILMDIEKLMSDEDMALMEQAAV
ncbi:chemotaxis protein CheW [Castellaniella sp. GW247-6E4]|uniref:chemotaxis protein CheW n=1 Tax=Castellaniella sp. GW247-6E4 TaxID=3140380 RepID=UPI0033164B15